jgi:molybdenum cofactor biosynthesis enzyme MoaA
VPLSSAIRRLSEAGVVEALYEGEEAAMKANGLTPFKLHMLLDTGVNHHAAIRFVKGAASAGPESNTIPKKEPSRLGFLMPKSLAASMTRSADKANVSPKELSDLLNAISELHAKNSGLEARNAAIELQVF